MQPPSTIALARSLRKAMTHSEAKIWQALRGKRLNGIRFRRQHVIGPYIVDFFCSAARLAIEVDGGVHGDEEAQARDALRDEWLARQGVRMLRIPNEMIDGGIDIALKTILEAIAGRQSR